MDLPGYADLVEVGRGASATVYRARQTAFDRPVAIKVLRGADLTHEGRRRFERECRTVGALSWHPHVVPVYDAGIGPDGSPFLVMELLSGGSLADALRAGGPPPVDEAVALTTQVADALVAAHRAGVLHRDVKPGNILLGHLGDAKLADFGIARVASAETALTAGVIGTFAYLAPELVHGAPASERSDVYSVSATLHVLLTGRAAFAGDDDASPVAAVLRAGRSPAPDLVASGLPEPVAAVVRRAMEPNPELRTPDAATLVAELQGAAAAMGWPRQRTVGDRAPASPATATGSAAAKATSATVARAPLAAAATAASPARSSAAPPSPIARLRDRRVVVAAVILAAAALAAIVFSAGVGRTGDADGDDFAGPERRDTSTVGDTETTVDDSDTTVDDTIEDSDTTVDGSDQTSPSFDSSDIPPETREQVIKLYMDMGLTEDQANCLLDKIFQNGAAENLDTADISAMMEFLGQCDISITDFSNGFGG